jgi:transposase InsO family protein
VKGQHGSPRIHEDLMEQQERVSRKRVIRLMQEDGLKARARKRYKVTTMSDHDQPVAANLLDRQFAAAAPNQRWVSDTTEFVIGSSGSGKLYLAAVLDLFSRFIVGWAVSAVNDRHVTINALEMALKRRCPEIGLLHHSDQGYASEDYQIRLAARGIVCSMSRRGNCWDNAVMESFFATVKSELGEHFESNGAAKMKLFDFIEVFYNAARSHASLAGHTPLTFAGGHTVARAELNNVRWVSHCRDLVQLPVAA